jgi:lincosamide nucleotidyltransferase A/C/D/E
MTLEQVLAVMDILRSLGCRFWLEGGWGVDALVGRQTRPHRDVDIDFDGTFEEDVLAALLHIGYAVEMDWWPNCVELGAPGRGWIDLHPLVLDDEGNARQAAMAADGTNFPARSSPPGVSRTCRFPASRRKRSAFSIPATNHAQWIGTTWRSWNGSQRADVPRICSTNRRIGARRAPSIESFA